MAPQIRRDEKDVQLLYEMKTETWKNHFTMSGKELCIISTFDFTFDF